MKFGWLVIGIWLLVILPAFALEVGGYYENDMVGLVKRDGLLAAGDLSRFRLRIDSKINPILALHLEPRYYYLIKTENLPLSGVSSLDQCVFDRAYAKLYLPLLSLTCGKQRIAWGTGYIWNPTDVFNPFVLSFAVKEEDETNVEAVRLEIPLGAVGGIDGYVLTGNEWNKTKKGIRAKGNLGLFDLSASYVDLGSEGSQVGFDSAGEIFGVGIRNEIAFISPSASNGYIQSVLGWDYTLENGVGLNLEYFFSGIGNISQPGKNYFYFGLNKIMDEITSIGMSFLLNADDGSFMVYPDYRRNVLQNLDLDLAAMFTFGEDGSEFKPSSSQDPTGLLGSNLVLLKLRYNF